MANRNAEMRGLWQDWGGRMTMRTFALRLREAGFYEDSQWGELALRGAMSKCREALKEEGTNVTHGGIPFAGPTREKDDDGSPVWVMLAMMDYPDMEWLIGQRVDSLHTDRGAVVRLQDYCRERFGKAPEIPDLLMPETVA